MANGKRMPEWEGKPQWQERLFCLAISDPLRARKVAQKIPLRKFDVQMLDAFLNSEIREVRDVGREIAIMKEVGEKKQMGFREQLFRLAIFLLASAVCAGIFYLGFASNPKQFLAEGYGFVAGGCLLFGAAALFELFAILIHFKKYWLG